MFPAACRCTCASCRRTFANADTRCASWRRAATAGKRDDAWIVGRAIPVRGNGSVARISFGPQVAMVVARALREVRPDIIHVHEPLVPSVSMHAVLNANAPVVATFHSNVGRERMSSLWFKLAAPMVRPVWNRLARRIAVSDAARHSVTSRMGDDELLIVPNGVDVERFAAAKAGEAPALAGTCCSSGRLEERKGFRDRGRGVRATGRSLSRPAAARGGRRQRARRGG